VPTTGRRIGAAKFGLVDPVGVAHPLFAEEAALDTAWDSYSYGERLALAHSWWTHRRKYARPSADWPDRAVVAVDLARVRAVIDRIAADVDVLARARRVQDPSNAAVLPDSRAERRRRLAEPDLEYRAFCTRRRLPASPALQPERAWDRALAIVEATADPMSTSGHSRRKAADQELVGDRTAEHMNRGGPGEPRTGRSFRSHPADERPAHQDPTSLVNRSSAGWRRRAAKQCADIDVHGIEVRHV
jgi:hypothetical protein